MINLLTIIATMMMMISMTLMMLSMSLSKKTFNDREKSSPFECGFDPKTSARLPFSLHFYLIAIIFLIFDIEITMILPLMMTMKITNIKTTATMTLMFVLILLLGLYHEWNQSM
uniref:NADH-ubiquinone oxidoreductase chain 3 n=1 Tax=Platerodrilus sp. MNCN/DNA:86739 TaxID=1905348 RepID=A0A342Z5E8_9COLE|nr:NADH dehydrogenase subunit 3 [Platerodrilus sp. MNCN/DNA:86739]